MALNERDVLDGFPLHVIRITAFRLPKQDSAASMTTMWIECAIMWLVFAITINALESSEIRMLESEYGKRASGYRTLFTPNEYTIIERRDAKLMDPLIRFGKRTTNMGGKQLTRNVRTEDFQSSPLIRFGKRDLSAEIH
ncbi:FMRFamide-like neuropeptide 13 [Toxocara canis]|uniref:FMRFamide-like neuropeptide 13 n=1 Tax=Toxocara canis TaxID=6265 RepID=A0A0B2VL99_TOXCA|nr:FMRFamide-like neuropeptide 13 [Toxocara canis]